MLVAYLAAVIVPPLAGPPPASDLAMAALQPMRPLVGALFLGHGYRFFAPNPGPGHSIQWTMKMADGMNYNMAFPGNQIAMVAPLSDGIVKYQDGTPAKVENYAKDVAAFLAWAADPTLESRKSTGWIVMLYLAITALLLFVGKKRIWASAH